MNIKIVLIAPGYMPLPAPGWGAVERIVWDYYEILKQRGYNVHIVNEANPNIMVHKCNELNPTIVHIMYDDHIIIAPYLACKRIYYTSHYAYITQPEFEKKHAHYFANIFQRVIQYRDLITINAISEEIKNVYVNYGFPDKKINVIRNGAREDNYLYTNQPLKGDKSIYLAKVEWRKGQYKYQSLPQIDFIGNFHDSPFDKTHLNYLGEWSKDQLYEHLSDYGNLILLSEGEADPLVVKEALMAGLGVVVSECSAANLDRTKPFITVIPNAHLNDLVYVQSAIAENRQRSLTCRADIRQYALEHFAWNKIIDEYARFCIHIMKIALIGPGIMPIPPPGWGAVEILIWDYYTELTKLGHTVQIINKIRQHSGDQAHPQTPYCQDLIREINAGGFDFVHLHYDCLYHILPYLTAKKVGITSHYPYIDNEYKHRADGFSPMFDFMVQNKKYLNFILAQKDLAYLKSRGAQPNLLYLLENGINSALIQCKTAAADVLHPEKTIYLGQINVRKGQHKYCQLQNMDIIGPDGNDRLPNYKGAWTRDEVQHKLTDYGNLLLLSKGEADPLVVKEALMAGLGVVVNATSAKNLIIADTASASASASVSDFITIIADEQMDNLAYIQSEMDANRQRSLGRREQIRAYAVKHFAWPSFIEKYVKNITN
jgi:glycosyltransferase involved in cell wall biosynthesis